MTLKLMFARISLLMILIQSLLFGVIVVLILRSTGEIVTQLAEKNADFIYHLENKAMIGRLLVNDQEGLQAICDRVESQYGVAVQVRSPSLKTVTNRRVISEVTRQLPLIFSGQDLGVVEIRVPKPPVILTGLSALMLTTLLLFGISVVLFLFGMLRVKRLIIDPLTKISDHIEGKTNGCLRLSKDIPSEITQVGIQYENFRLQSAEKKRLEIAAEKHATIINISKQVAHDIRSPLAALEMFSHGLSELPEDRRLLLRHGIGRIRDIAYNLLEYKSDLTASNLPFRSPAVVLLPALVGRLISEKREQYRDRPDVEIGVMSFSSDYGLFAHIQPVDFARLLSNIINNAVEAIDGHGRVAIRHRVEGDEIIRIEVSDTGCGISPEILPRLLQRGETHGKSEGLGLGLAHARECLEAWGGGIKINSQLGTGTTVTIMLPQARTPNWFVDRLEFANGASVVVLDDDPSIHEIWKKRFGEATAAGAVELIHFYSSNDLRDWLHLDIIKAEKAFYLVDYELGETTSGLDVLLALKLVHRTILVTSQFDEFEVKKRCEEEKIGLIPKEMAAFVPISVGKAHAKVDAVLIDNDPLVRMNWGAEAKRRGLVLHTFQSSSSFFKSAHLFDRKSPVYVDLYLGENRDGQEIAQEIRALGFDKIYIATGYGKAISIHTREFCGVVGKDPPWIERT